MVELKERSADRTTFVAVGKVSPSELFEAYCAFLDSGPTPLTVVDLSSATLAGIDAESMRELARRVAQLGKQRHVRGKAAIVCSRDVDFGMARMFSTLASLEGHPMEFAVFPGLNSARAWLAGETHYP
jgi:hypothetical protein